MVTEWLVPEEVRVLDVSVALGLSEEVRVHIARVAVHGSDGGDRRVQLGRIRGVKARRRDCHGVVESRLNRCSRIGCLVPCVHTDVRAETCVGLCGASADTPVFQEVPVLTIMAAKL